MMQLTDARCPFCNRKLFEWNGRGAVSIQCPKCKHLAQFPAKIMVDKAAGNLQPGAVLR